MTYFGYSGHSRSAETLLIMADPTSRRFRAAESAVEQGRPEKALATLFSEWVSGDKHDPARLAQFHRLLTITREAAYGETKEKAGAFLLMVERHRDGEVPVAESSPGQLGAAGDPPARS